VKGRAPRDKGGLAPRGRVKAREAGRKEEKGMLVVYGINEESEIITPITHLALLTSEEARKVELWDFFQSPEEDAPAPFNDRLVVLPGFEDIARHRGETAAEHLGRELIGNFLMANYDGFFPFLPQHEVAYVGSLRGGGHLRALAQGKEWAVDVVQDLCGPPGVVLTRGLAEDPEKAKAQALEAAYRVLGAL
jgi:hypothetical protein